MSAYLLDTSVVSLALRPDATDTDRQRLTRLESVSSIAAIVLDELRFGVLRLPKGRRRDALASTLDDLVTDGLPVLPFDQSAAEWHAAECARLEALGQTPPFADRLIAAVAAANDLTLVTRNESDFADFEGLRVEAW